MHFLQCFAHLSANHMLLTEHLLYMCRNLTSVEIMPAQAPAASLPGTESSSALPLKSFCR